MFLFSSSGLHTQEFKADRRFHTALKESRKRRSITHRDQVILQSPSNGDLWSLRLFARLCWGKAFCDELEKHLNLDEDQPYFDQPLFLITITDVSCVTSDDATKIPILNFKRKLQAGLKGLNYIGMVEPGLYVNVTWGTRLSMKRAVSWHLHAICWGTSRKVIKKLFARLNRDQVYRSILDSQLGAHWKVIPDTCLPKKPHRTFLADKLRYVLKSPKCAYRVRKSSRVTADGEIVGCLRRKKSELRHGDRITLFHSMKHLQLDDLAAAGGEGTGVMRGIKRRAVQLANDE
jgi:hypothetical protein